MEEGWRPILNGVLLGDSGYLLLEWLMAPIEVNIDAASAAYNRAHKKTRRLVENTMDDLVRCPDVPTHVVKKSKLGNHILKCRINRGVQTPAPPPAVFSDCDGNFTERHFPSFRAPVLFRAPSNSESLDSFGIKSGSASETPDPKGSDNPFSSPSESELEAACKIC
nr:unnamed protein product [Callosobruchus analis]